MLMSKEIIRNFRFYYMLASVLLARRCDPKAQIIKNLPSVMNVGSRDGINGEPKSNFWNQLAALALAPSHSCPRLRFVNLRLGPFALPLPWSSHRQTPHPQ